VQFVEQAVTLPVDYHEFTDNDQTNVSSTTTSFTLRNTATAPVTVTVNVTGLPAKYVATSRQVTIPANGTSETITLTLAVPHEKDSGREKIGIISVVEGTTQVASMDLLQDTKSMLKVDKVQVEYTSEGDSDESDNLDLETRTSASLDEDVKVGTELIFNFNLDNLFHQDYDDQGVLENVKITFDADDNDIFPDEFEEEFDLDDIDVDSDQDFVVQFTIPDDTDAGDYNIELTFEAEDGEGATYTLVREVDLNLRRERNDLRIMKAELIPSTITACDGSFTFEVDVENMGTKDQRSAGISIVNTNLRINENIRDLVLEDYSSNDNTWTRTFNFPLNTIRAGTYPIDINVYYDKDKTIDHERVNVVIGECASAAGSETLTPAVRENRTTVTTVNPPRQSTTTTSAGTTVTVAPGTTEQTQPQTGQQPATAPSTLVQTIENPYSAQDFMVAMIIVAMVLVLALIVIFFVVLLRR